jgi:hypothetical protein
MAQRRASSGDEVSLFPFLSILACLIGALVLLIVVLAVSQAGKAEGRSAEEIRMAQEFLRMKKELEQRKQLDLALKEKIAELEKLQKEVEEKQQRFIKLRRLLDSSKEVQEQNQQISQQLQKELDNLLVEIDGLKKQQTSAKEEIAKLEAELKARKVPEDKKVPPVVVQPSGSGMSATPEIVVADAAYNHLLYEVAKDKNSLILFLIRDDGQGPFNNGAGRAEGDYKIRIGKLPIPGRGQLDLALFDKYRGKIDPPVPGAAVPTPAPNP